MHFGTNIHKSKRIISVFPCSLEDNILQGERQRKKIYRQGEDILILKLNRVVIYQNMPALNLLVFVLEAFVPVLQTLSFSLDA